MIKKRLLIIIISVVLSVAAGVATAFWVVNFLGNTAQTELQGNLSDFYSNSDYEDNSSITESVLTSQESIPEAPKPTLVFTSPSKNGITVTEPSVTFTGKSDLNIPLSLDGQEITRDEKGGFSFSKELKVGKNQFNFLYDGKTVTYTVNYRYVVIKGYSPSTKQIFSSGSVVFVEVNAKNGSNVTSTLNGQTITLSPKSDSSGDFVAYSGSFKLPADNYSDLNLGKIKYTATHNGITETFYSGNVTCKRPDFIVEYDPNATPIGERYVNVGSGKIAEIIAYEAESFDPGETNDQSKPTNNYLPKGTVDYAAQEYIYYKGTTKYAVLRCGKQVYTEKTDIPTQAKYAVIKEYAGTLPDHNEIGISSFENGTQHTVLTLNTMWKAPFFLDILPQKYTNPSKRDFTISQPTYNYIDITFCYATVFEGEISVPDDNPLFKSAKIIKNQSDYTLRLELKKQGAFYGWDANYNSQGQLVFEFLNPAKVTPADNAYGVDLTGVEIFIDVGHGGIDPGAVRKISGKVIKDHTEAIENLALAKKLKTELESIGATVRMNRTSDTTSSNTDKIKLLKQYKPDYCIAIHHNSSTSSSSNGFEAGHYYPFASNATKYIWQSTYNTGIYKKHKLYWHYYYMARCSYCPVVLTENGFISSSFDYANIINQDISLKKAKALAKGVADYFLSIK